MESASSRMFRREALLAALVLALPRRARADVPPDSVAQCLAGMAGASVAPARDTAEWASYARREDERWEHEGPRLRAMQEWSARELAPLLPRERPVIYPFAGPDALHALALFGDSPRLLLIGLEPVGDLPDTATMVAPRYFARLGDAMEDLHRLTFFRTHALASDFDRAGVLPALLATVARMGGLVTRAELVTRGVRIDWQAKGVVRRLDYRQADLANAGLARDPQLVASMRALGPCVSFLKAASYLLAEPRFSFVRRMILEDSDVVVQDDTGIPFHAFDARWALRFFGRYEAPLSPFQDRLQPDLQREFARRAPSPLPFGIGYHVEARSSNLLVASKVRG